MKDNRKKVQEEILKELKYPVHGILLLSPRIGKTKLGIEIIKHEKPNKVLWITPSTKLRDEDIPREFEEWKAKSYLSKTDIICYSSLSKQEGIYDKIIFDEIQFITENNVGNFFNGKLKTRTVLGLTGTMPEHKEKLDLIKKFRLFVLKDISIDNAVEQNVVSDYKIKILEVPMNDTLKNIKAGTKDKPFFTTEKAAYEYHSKNIAKMMFVKEKQRLQFAILNRLRFIYKSPTKLETAKHLIKYLKGRKLVFTGSIEHAEALSDHTYHSKTNRDHLNLFLDQKIDLLACVNAGGTGFTYKNVDYFIIVQADSNKSGGFIQKLARSLLLQKNYKAEIWIISLQQTQDEVWISNALKQLDQNKIEYVNIKNLKL